MPGQNRVDPFCKLPAFAEQTFVLHQGEARPHDVTGQALIPPLRGPGVRSKPRARRATGRGRDVTDPYPSGFG